MANRDKIVLRSPIDNGVVDYSKKIIVDDISQALRKGETNKFLKRVKESNPEKFDRYMSYAMDGEVSIQPEDLPTVIEEGDLIQFPFRQLSAAVVGAGSWKATDFTNEAMLRNSMPLMRNKPAYTNHNMSVGNEVGFIGEPIWDTGHTTESGISVPAGINAPFVIDRKLFPDIARKLSSPVPYIKSSSVTVLFEWEPSHEFEDPMDFMWHLGDKIDGEVVRKIVTRIVDYYESSFVWLGADPYAGILDEEGRIIFVDMDGVEENEALSRENIMGISEFKKDPLKALYDKERKYIVENCEFSDYSLSLSKGKSVKPPKKSKEMNEVLLKLSEKLGKKVEEINPELLENFTFVTKEDKQGFDALSQKVETLKGEKKTLEDKVNSYKNINIEGVELEEQINLSSVLEKSKLFDKSVTDLQKQAVELYKKSHGDKAKEVIVNEINKTTDVDALEAKIEMFGGKLINEFTAKCEDCDSEKINFRSSKDDSEGDEGENNDFDGDQRYAMAQNILFK